MYLEGEPKEKVSIENRMSIILDIARALNGNPFFLIFFCFVFPDDSFLNATFHFLLFTFPFTALHTQTYPPITHGYLSSDSIFVKKSESGECRAFLAGHGMKGVCTFLNYSYSFSYLVFFNLFSFS